MWVVLALRAAIRLRTKPDQVTLGSRGRIPVKPAVPTVVPTGVLAVVVLVAVLVVVPLRQATPRRVIPRQITRRQIIPRRATPVVTQVVTPVVTQVVPTLAAPRPISPVSGYCFWVWNS